MVTVEAFRNSGEAIKPMPSSGTPSLSLLSFFLFLKHFPVLGLSYLSLHFPSGKAETLKKQTVLFKITQVVWW